MPLGQPDVAQDAMGIPNSYNSFQVDDVEEAISYEPGNFSKPPTGTYNVQIGPFQLITRKTDQSGHWMKGYALNIVDPGEHEGKEIGQVIWSPEDNPDSDDDPQFKTKGAIAKKRIAQLMKGAGLTTLSNLSQLEGKFLQVDAVFDGKNHDITDVRAANLGQSFPETEAVVSDKIPF